MVLTEYELAQIIDQWYFEWKSKFNNTPYGIAKENLKMRIAQVEESKKIYNRVKK